MKRKDDMKAALECRTPEVAVPIWELEFHLWDKFYGDQMFLGQKFEVLTSKEKERALHKNAEIISAVSQKLKFAAVTVPGGYWEIAPGEPAYYWLSSEWRYDQIKILKEYIGNEVMLVGSSGGVMAMPSASHYLEFCYKLFDAPEEVDEMALNSLNNGIRNAEILAEAGVEAVYTASVIADNRGLFFNPEQMNRFILPYLKKWAENIKNLGLYSILHSDGNLNSCINEIVESGVNALQAIDPIAGMNIKEVRERTIGRLCLCGNIDCGAIHMSSQSEIYELAKATLFNCKSDGGFVLGASNAVQIGAKIESYLAIIKAWEDFGAYRGCEVTK